MLCKEWRKPATPPRRLIQGRAVRQKGRHTSKHARLPTPWRPPHGSWALTSHNSHQLSGKAAAAHAMKRPSGAFAFARQPECGCHVHMIARSSRRSTCGACTRDKKSGPTSCGRYCSRSKIIPVPMQRCAILMTLHRPWPKFMSNREATRATCAMSVSRPSSLAEDGKVRVPDQTNRSMVLSQVQV